jgi:hypothetical protein
MHMSITMTIIEEDVLIRRILIGTMPDGSPISSGAKADVILARYVAGEVPSGLRRLVALGISKSARDACRKGGRSHA